jgi:hypothetical protein
MQVKLLVNNKAIEDSLNVLTDFTSLKINKNWQTLFRLLAWTKSDYGIKK